MENCYLEITEGLIWLKCDLNRASVLQIITICVETRHLCTSSLKVGESGQIPNCHMSSCLLFLAVDEVAKRLEEAGLVKELLHTDHRLQVNRGRQLKMYRVWIQACYRHPGNRYPGNNKTKDN